MAKVDLDLELVFERLMQVLQSCEVDYTADGTVKRITGYIRNLRVRANKHRITVENSLAKFYNGNNLEQFSFNRTRAALASLSEALSLDVRHFQVSRLHLGVNLLLVRPVYEYLPLLCEAGGYERSTNNMKGGNGVYFTQSEKSIVVYDKILEMKAKKELIPQNYRDSNVMRMELRFDKHVSRQTGMKRITATDLAAPGCYIHLAELLSTALSAIEKQQEPLCAVHFTGVTDMMDKCTLQHIEANGGMAILYEKLRSERKAGIITKSQHRSMKERIKKLYQKSSLTTGHNLIQELDTKVREAVKQCVVQ